MKSMQNQNQIVFTNRARCRDCYRCIRVCPVGAIGIQDGQAFVDEQRCISCGTCIRECPQQAKTYRNDLADVQDMVRRDRRVAVSLAPSFACLYEPWQIKRIPSMLRRLGFSYVAETAVGAGLVSESMKDLMAQQPSKTWLSTACPAFVRYILHYRPELKSHLMPLVSPMMAHARHLKSKLGGETKVVFVGPCVAKKYEVRRDAEKWVDAVLTFDELRQWFEQEKIVPANFEESAFDEQPSKTAVVYPLEGGGLKTSDLDVNPFELRTLAVSGFDEINDTLDSIARLAPGSVIEPLFCTQGCINGPLLRTDKPLFERRRAVLNYCASCQEPAVPASAAALDLTCAFNEQAWTEEDFSEEQIRRVLEKTGKLNPEDQLNCGACGYSSCRRQAKAVLRNMAEIDMCVPYMRRLAEQRTDKIIETSPNGIVILDMSLSILHMNSSFKKLFMCTHSALGKPISYLMDAEPFEKVAVGELEQHHAAVHHRKYSLVCQQIIYALPQEGQIVGLFVDLTGMMKNKDKYDQLQSQTLEQARTLLRHQTEMAGKIAEYLGASAAQSEQLLVNLMRIAEDKKLHNGQEPGQWLNDIYTAK
jgi:iron only hydrogenase large subunit-like protein/uncharacterized Fe-S cluster-containing protein